MATELKPCPFCGGKADVYAVTEYPHRVNIRCVKCGMSGATYTNEKKAAAAWNTRAAVTDEQFAYAVHDGRVWKAVE